jgi:hypothetical protein
MLCMAALLNITDFKKFKFADLICILVFTIVVVAPIVLLILTYLKYEKIIDKRSKHHKSYGQVLIDGLNLRFKKLDLGLTKY